MNRLNIFSIFLAIAISVGQVYAFGTDKPNFTLQKLGVASNILLTAADRASTKNKLCGMNSDEISVLSQRLYEMVQGKIEKLSDGDLEVIQSRAKSCKANCTCTIDLLALEAKAIENSDLKMAAAEIDANQRKICLGKVKDPCQDAVISALKDNP